MIKIPLRKNKSRWGSPGHEQWKRALWTWGGWTWGPCDFQLNDPAHHGDRALLRQGGSVQCHVWIWTHDSGDEARKEPSSLAPHFSIPFPIRMSPITQEVGWFIQKTVEPQDVTPSPPKPCPLAGNQVGCFMSFWGFPFLESCIWFL